MRAGAIIADMRWAAGLLVALVGCTSAPSDSDGIGDPWKAPAARWVSDLGRFDARYTYNEVSSVSDGGRWVVFASYVKTSPSRVFLMDTQRNRVRRIDDSFDGGPRTSEGVGRYNVAFDAPNPQITPDGRFVVFSSAFSNLVRGDDNRAVDVFVYDRVTRRTRIVSRSNRGRQGNGDSSHPAISANGRFVVFDSHATNLSPDDPDRGGDVYLRDLRTGTTELVSIGPNGKGDEPSGSPDVSDDGDRISFGSGATNLVQDDANGTSDVFARDRSTETTIRVSVSSSGEEYETFDLCESAGCYPAGTGESRISGNGEVVVFTAHANGFVPEDQNYNPDVFTHQIDTGVTERVSVHDDGSDAYGPESVECGKDPVCSGFTDTRSPSISRDGTLVYFISAAPEISDEDDDEEGRGSEEQVFVRDRVNRRTLIVSRYRDGSVLQSTNWYPGEISADGRWVTYSNNSIKLDGPRGDQDPGPDVFLQRLPSSPPGSMGG
jgi:Tol biopolymer transport system component